MIESSKACFEQWAKHTDHKATLMNVGPTFMPFTKKEIKQFLGLFVMQGLSPSPQINQKIKPQVKDLVNGNDLFHNAFGCDAELRLKILRDALQFVILQLQIHLRRNVLTGRHRNSFLS